MLYPLKFKPIYKEVIWGGEEFENVLKRKLPKNSTTVGESWEVAAIGEDVSVVENGALKGNNLDEIAEIYMDELLGDKVYKKFGYGFPLLIKLIDAQQNLSVQVHPNDTTAKEKHQSYGKTEMWYVVSAKPGAKLYIGFNQPVDKAKYLEYFNAGKLEMLLREYEVAAGDAFFIPAGTIHAIGSGTLIAEVQQNSDITYRVYDYNRVDSSGNGRELHTDLALDVIDFQGGNLENFSLFSKKTPNEFVELISCDYFCTKILDLRGKFAYDFADKDSFVVLMCLDGVCSVSYDFQGAEGGEQGGAQRGAGEGERSGGRGVESLVKGQTMLLPAVLGEVVFEGEAIILSSYVP